MISCLYKKAFLKDLARLPLPYRQQIEKLVFEEIPRFDNFLSIPNIRKMQGYQGYYRIRAGDYRIGCELKEAKVVIFYRVKSRTDIYKLFP